MPISEAGKKDLRQTILDSIASKYGHESALVMEKAYKTQDKQIEEAMTEGGMTATDIAQTRGIDLGQFASQNSMHDPNSPTSSVSSNGLNELPKMLPPKNIFGASSVTPGGDIQRAGFLNLFGVGERTLLDDLTKLSQIDRRSQMSQTTPMDAITFDPNTGKYFDQSGQEVTELKKGQQVRTAALSPEMMGNRESAKQTEAQKYFKEPEIQGLNDLKDAKDTLAEVRSGLEEMGIKDPLKYGGVISETINSELGPISLPARFNLYGQYAKDPKYTAMKTKMERAFQKFRKIVTGAQASNQELQSLRPLIASFKDRPGVFFANLSSLEDETGRMLSNRLDTYDDVGRDTSRLRKRFQTNPDSGTTTKGKVSDQEAYKEYLKMVGGK